VPVLAGNSPKYQAIITVSRFFNEKKKLRSSLACVRIVKAHGQLFDQWTAISAIHRTKKKLKFRVRTICSTVALSVYTIYIYIYLWYTHTRMSDVIPPITANAWRAPRVNFGSPHSLVFSVYLETRELCIKDTGG
jgi:hypothetical protein